MATDYDAPRKTEEELNEDSIEELKTLDVILTCQGGDYTSEVFPKLREAVTSELRERGYRNEPVLAFVEAEDLPGAYALIGTLDAGAPGARASVSARVFKDGKQIGCTFGVPVPDTNMTRAPALATLAAALVDGALTQLHATSSTSPGGCPLP